MPEVQNLPYTLFRRILRHHFILDGYRVVDIVYEKLRHVQGLHLFIKIVIPNQAVFDDLSESRNQLSALQRFKKFRRNKDGFRLGKRADNIFNVVQINPGLSPYRGVDLRQQSCRYLHEVDTALESRRRKAPHVGHYSPTQIDQEALTVCTEIEHHFPNTDTKIDVLVLFTWVDLDHIVLIESRHGFQHNRKTIRIGISICENEDFCIIGCLDE